MAVYYSDHFSGGDNTVMDKGKRVSAAIGHGRLRYSRAEVTTLASPLLVATDTIRMMQFKSGDHLNELRITSTDSGDTGGLGIGIYKSGRNHDGASLDHNILGTPSIADGERYLERLGMGNPDMDLFRGKALWEMVTSAGSEPAAGTYTRDPVEDWDLVLTCSTSVTVATTIIIEAFFTGGD